MRAGYRDQMHGAMSREAGMCGTPLTFHAEGGGEGKRAEMYVQPYCPGLDLKGAENCGALCKASYEVSVYGPRG